MSADVISQNSFVEENPEGSHCEWVRLNFTGMTSGNPPIAAFQGALTLRNGETRHIRLHAYVPDKILQLRLLNIAAGTEVRILIETDWKQPQLPTELKDVVLLTDD
jgi:hypothetical protein